MARLGSGLNQERFNGVEFGKRLRTIRKEKKITVQRLADQAGVLPGFINQLEAGDRVPSFTTLIHLINALEVSADELLYSYLSHPTPGTIDRRVSRLMKDLDDEQRSRIEAHIALEISMINEKK